MGTQGDSAELPALRPAAARVAPWEEARIGPHALEAGNTFEVLGFS